MQEVLDIFKNYNGTGYYCILFLIGLIYLWFTEEDRKTKCLLVYAPAVIQILFFIPYFYLIYNKLDEGTYYRILWIMPMTVVIAYSACKVIGRHTRIGLAMVSVLLIISGTYVYKSVYMSKAENLYHIPQEAVDICEMIKPEEGEERIWAVFPPDLVHFIRQYTTTIQMPYGRDNMVESWKTVINPLYPLYQQETIDAKELSNLSKEYNCHYIILMKSKIVDGNLSKYNIEKIGETENYIVYRNEPVAFFKR